MFRSSTQPIAAASLCGDAPQDVASILPCLLHFTPKLRFLGCEWCEWMQGATIPEDVKPLRDFAELECIRWSSLTIPKKRQLRKLARLLDPKYYAGPSLRAVQQGIERYERVWRRGDDQTNYWHLDLGEFMSPPLTNPLCLMKFVFNVLS